MTYPLSTSSRWIVDENGQRAKLMSCGGERTKQAKQPVDAVAKKIVEMSFNCVRLTWPSDLMTNETLAYNVTVRQSFQSFGLNDDIVGFKTNNPSIIDLSLIEAFICVTEVNVTFRTHNTRDLCLAFFLFCSKSNDVMVILDNHLTKPGWCCADNDGNDFSGDKFFDPTVWAAALSKMTATFDGVSNVVGMSLRNELTGPKQNVNDWFKYMQQGAEAVHSANKNVLVILSGLTFDTDLSFVRCLPVNLSFTGKLVFELHWYSFSSKPERNSGGFLLNQGFPLFLSEFGMDKREINANDDRYFGCLTGWTAENDVDWSIWALTGSYILNTSVRKSSFLEKISLLQSTLQGPGPRTDDYNLVLDPLTRLCLSSGPENLVKMTRTGCSGPGSKWQTDSASRMHLSSTTSNKLHFALMWTQPTMS
ncbi:predicted protein [Arabidopsis lyrata subsp. lyrata]|uniref:Predicted protein n=1 Tax=Arabidopsis lyrata subsp. lyrata TaxID=81972 RepID=D7KMW3_ARALL|nr:predicted protein [Arabidopsis lyrata subsp. lyrata]